VKAHHFEGTGLVPTLDSASNTVVKSDSVVSSELQNDLQAAFDQLHADQASNVDWHPRSNEMVQDLVHPSMYPFIYGILSSGLNV
jgi:glutathionyl-hydroquinone reductase